MKLCRLVFTICLFLLFLPFKVYGKCHYLFKSGKSDYTIVVSPSADELTLFAAQEFHYWIKKISGVAIPIENLRNDGKRKSIIIGSNADSYLQKYRIGSLQEDAYSYKNIDDNIIICGSGRGVMYGVYAFLRNEFNCRWYTIDFEKIPHKDEYCFTVLDYQSSPAFPIRDVFYYNAWQPQWRIRNGLNQQNAYPPREPRKMLGGSYIFCGAHTFNQFVPREEYFEAHPEYYSEINGKRYAGNAQLCLSNPDVLKLCTEAVLKQITEYPDYYAYSVAQNDCLRPCECKDCKKLVEKYGTQSGAIIWFVNQIADVVKQKYPDKFISTIAYQYSMPAPSNIRPRDNVLINLCDIDCCAIHGWEDCPENQSFLNALSGWTSISNNVFVTDYVANYMEYFNPIPDFFTVQSRIQKCRDLGCAGLREYGVNQAPWGEFAALRTYVLAQLLWDPDANVENLVNEFIEDYYGASAPYIKEYYKLLQSKATENNHLFCNSKFSNDFYNDQFVAQMTDVLNKAASVANVEDVLHRVEMLQLSPMYLKCKRQPEKAIRDGSYAFVMKVVERENITHFGEGTSVEKFKQFMTDNTQQSESLWERFIRWLGF